MVSRPPSLPPPRPELRVYATLWSLRQYPSARRQWSLERKLAAIARAGFHGVMAPPEPALTDRGPLDYWAIGSLGVRDDPVPFLARSAALGAQQVTIQLGDVDSPPAAALRATLRLLRAGDRAGLPVAVETHRDTFTELPEPTWRLCDAVQRRTGRLLPLCWDPSHFAVVRHLAPPYFAGLHTRPDLLAHATQFHLRPFTGHHGQIPATRDGRRRLPEYREWLRYVAELFAFLRAHSTAPRLHVVPELGHAAPAYGLSLFPDTWVDAQIVARDLCRLWRSTRSPSSAAP